MYTGEKFNILLRIFCSIPTYFHYGLAKKLKFIFKMCYFFGIGDKYSSLLKFIYTIVFKKDSALLS